jgi:hypothetical protein
VSLISLTVVIEFAAVKNKLSVEPVIDASKVPRDVPVNISPY